MAYGPEWRSLQVANPNVSGLMATVQDGFNNAGNAGRDVLTAYDEGQKLKNDAAVAQELAGISTPEQMTSWLQNGGLNGRNVSGASLEAMLNHRRNVFDAARELEMQTQRLAASGSSGGGRRTGGGRRRSGSSESEGGTDLSTDALLALALGQVPATPAATPTGVVRPVARPETGATPAPVPAGPAPFVPGATSTEIQPPDFSSLSDDDLAAEIAALGG